VQVPEDRRNHLLFLTAVLPKKTAFFDRRILSRLSPYSPFLGPLFVSSGDVDFFITSPLRVAACATLQSGV
jgi:hypothetical protein